MQMKRYKDFVNEFREKFKNGTNIVTELKGDELWGVFVIDKKAVFTIDGEIKYEEDL